MDYMPPTLNDMKEIMTPATAADSARARQALASIRRKIDAAFQGFDLVVVPTTTSLPKPIKDALKVEMSDGKPTKAFRLLRSDVRLQQRRAVRRLWHSSVDAALRLFEERPPSGPDDRRPTLLRRQGAGARLRLPASDQMAHAKANPHTHNGGAAAG